MIQNRFCTHVVYSYISYYLLTFDKFKATNENGGPCGVHKKCVGGFSRLHKQISTILKENPESIVLNAGDSFQGTFWYTVGKWNITSQFMNTLRIDAETKSNTGNLKFLPESASVNEEAERLVREEDVFTNIVLSHSGYSIDKEIAANASTSISLIVGGHTHTFLFTGDKPPGPEPVRGPYPKIVRSKHGQKVLITQVSCASRYLGNITMLLDKHGKVFHFSGNPIFLDSSFPQDEKINEMLVPWQKLIDTQGEKVIGSTLLSLNITRCHYQECSLGDFVTDSMVFAYDSSSNGSTSGVDCAVTNPGGLRGDLNIGNITYNELSTAQPFRNTIDIAKIKGEDLKRMFEFSAQPKQFSKLNLLQVSGIKMSYNLSQPQGNRVVSLKIRCRNCTHQIYEDLQLGHHYTIALPSFLTKGGTGFNFLEDVLIATKTGPLDMEVFQDYLSKHSPISYLDSERITVYDSERQEL
ncbi:5'-nucleotidase-related protein isoform X2 [Leptinotarsa decemlineata]|uniref:5'-nucleotidase-related protein isoform X2 n=1 Tax=Leptinotarsa decemlineata TaxID=7539 RepID=UPI003D30B4B2